MKRNFLGLLAVLLVLTFAVSCGTDGGNPVLPVDPGGSGGQRDPSQISEVPIPDTTEINNDTIVVVDTRREMAVYQGWDTISPALRIPSGIWSSYGDEERIEIYQRAYILDAAGVQAGASIGSLSKRMDEGDSDAMLLGFYNNSMYMVADTGQGYVKVLMMENFTVRGDVIFGELLGENLIMRVASITDSIMVLEMYEVEYGITAEGNEVLIGRAILRSTFRRYDAGINIADIPTISLDSEVPPPDTEVPPDTIGGTTPPIIGTVFGEPFSVVSSEVLLDARATIIRLFAEEYSSVASGVGYSGIEIQVNFVLSGGREVTPGVYPVSALAATDEVFSVLVYFVNTSEEGQMVGTSIATQGQIEIISISDTHIEAYLQASDGSGNTVSVPFISEVFITTM